PEAILGIAAGARGLTITHRDEEVLFEPGGESLWESTRRGDTWTVRRLRLMDYNGNDATMVVPQITLALPPSITPPKSD
ncbi:MAG: hypothetical protein ACREF4_17910, partial [Gammaproteobacteria bacterium]